MLLSHWPQYAVAALILVDIGITAGDDKPMVPALISAGIFAWLLYMGGFWQ